MNVENYFLRYAYPCAFIIKDLGEIDGGQLKQLEDCAVNNKPIDKKVLEKIFFRAFEKIERLAAKLGKDKWDMDVIRNYFLEVHNQEIDKGEGYYATASETIKELSKVRKAVVLEVGDGVLKVKYGNTEKKVVNKFIPDVKVGDKVSTHFSLAIEKLQAI